MASAWDLNKIRTFANTLTGISGGISFRLLTKNKNV